MAAARHGGRIHTLEGHWNPRRIALLEFPDRETALRWYGSPEYVAARKAREGIADFRAVLVDGVEGT